MATKKQNRRTEVRRLRRVLNSTRAVITSLAMSVHQWGYRSGAHRKSFEAASEHDKARYEEDEA